MQVGEVFPRKIGKQCLDKKFLMVLVEKITQVDSVLVETTNNSTSLGSMGNKIADILNVLMKRNFDIKGLLIKHRQIALKQ